MYMSGGDSGRVKNKNTDCKEQKKIKPTQVYQGGSWSGVEFHKNILC